MNSSIGENNSEGLDNPSSLPILQENLTPEPVPLKSLGILRKRWPLLTVGIIAVILITSVAWFEFPYDEEELVRQVLRESQMFESLVIYKNPSSFNDEILNKYWVPHSHESQNYDWKRIADSLQKLQSEGLRYGDETKCEKFVIQSVTVDKDATIATARTLEKWFISVHDEKGSPQKRRSVGPYFVDYLLRKVDGRWLVEKSTTGRTIRPVPHLSGIEQLTTASNKTEFLIRLTGRDFEPMTVFLSIVGPRCPEAKPCQIPNTALLERSTLSDSIVDNVPLTLSSGNFRIAAHNGDSQPSNYLYLSVP